MEYYSLLKSLHYSSYELYFEVNQDDYYTRSSEIEPVVIKFLVFRKPITLWVIVFRIDKRRQKVERDNGVREE